MAFALLVIGIVLLTSAIRNTQDCLVQLINADFTGPGNFAYWIVAFIVVGAIGYVDRLKKVSDGLLVLILVALFLSRGSPNFPGGGFFTQFIKALQGTETSATPKPTFFSPTGALYVVNPGDLGYQLRNPNSPYPLV